MEFKIEEFLASFGEKLNALTEEAFNTQVCVSLCVILYVFVSFLWLWKSRKVAANDTHPETFRNVKSSFSSYF